MKKIRVLLLALLIVLLTACAADSGITSDSFQEDDPVFAVSGKTEESAQSAAASSQTGAADSDISSEALSSAAAAENPATMPAENSSAAAENSQFQENYQKSLENASSMESYLRAALSAKDHGGIYILQFDTVTLGMWVVNNDALEAALSAYTGEAFDIDIKPARWSVEDMSNFSSKLDGIKLNDGEFLMVFPSEQENSLAVNIPKASELRLTKEINALIQENHIPPDCVTIFVIDSTEKNPVT
ncbi:MAG: hypothetical protein LBC56_01725 [Oscillospiraceae bacterium]|nr:hypothetical protein [Oscillospiraceae bacterium]